MDEDPYIEQTATSRTWWVQFPGESYAIVTLWEAVDGTRSITCDCKNNLFCRHKQAIDAKINEAPDALTGILSAAVTAQAGRCLICNEHPALYCGPPCASRGR